MNEFADIQARSGELAAGLAAIKKSGKSIAEIAQEQIDSVREQIDSVNGQQILSVRKAIGGT